MAENTQNETTQQNATQPAPKQKKNIMTIVIVAVVVVALGIGAWVWHETPHFCGTLCHNTMNEHLKNYEGTDASQGAGLAHVHQKANVTCLQCHTADLGTQLAEVNAQLTVTYNPERLILGSTYYVDTQTCLSCHEGSYEALAKKTESLEPYNPHDSIHGEPPYCAECHKGHTNQVDTCGQCHPNGGQTMKG